MMNPFGLGVEMKNPQAELHWGSDRDVEPLSKAYDTKEGGCCRAIKSLFALPRSVTLFGVWTNGLMVKLFERRFIENRIRDEGRGSVTNLNSVEQV
jgi:hypothetical protein